MFAEKKTSKSNEDKMNQTVNNMLENEFHSIVNTNIRNTIGDIEFQQKDDEDDTCMNICGCCTFMCSGFGILVLLGVCVGYLVWIGFSIKALTNVSNEDIKDKCEKSDLWPLLLTIVIYNGLSILVQLMTPTSNEHSDNRVQTYENEVIKMFLGLGLLIWTGIELMEPCVQKKLTNNIIYILLEYWFFFGCAAFAFLVCISCGLITLNAANNKKEKEDPITRLGV